MTQQTTDEAQGETMPQEPTGAPQSPEQATDIHEGTETTTTPDAAELMSEGRRYREKLREAKTANEELTERLTAAETLRNNVLRDSINRQLPEALTPELFWELTPELGPLLTEHGTPDPEAVQTAAQQLMDKYQIIPRPAPPVIPNQGKTPDIKSRDPKISDAFRPRSFD